MIKKSKAKTVATIPFFGCHFVRLLNSWSHVTLIPLVVVTAFYCGRGFFFFWPSSISMISFFLPRLSFSLSHTLSYQYRNSVVNLKSLFYFKFAFQVYNILFLPSSAFFFFFFPFRRLVYCVRPGFLGSFT